LQKASQTSVGITRVIQALLSSDSTNF